MIWTADVNLIDHERLTIKKPVTRHDLPLGAKRLVQKAEGYVATIKTGQVTWCEGEPTQALPRKLIRGAQSAPRAAQIH